MTGDKSDWEKIKDCRLYELSKKYQSGLMDLYKKNGVSSVLEELTKRTNDMKSIILTAWYAEFGFSPGSAIVVEDYSYNDGTCRVYIKEATAEEIERNNYNISRMRTENSLRISALDYMIENKQYYYSCDPWHRSPGDDHYKSMVGRSGQVNYNGEIFVVTHHRASKNNSFPESVEILRIKK